MLNSVVLLLRTCGFLAQLQLTQVYPLPKIVWCIKSLWNQEKKTTQPSRGTIFQYFFPAMRLLSGALAAILQWFPRCWKVRVDSLPKQKRYVHPVCSIYGIFIWVNYNISLTWIKAILGWFPLLTMISSEGEQWGRYNLPRSMVYLCMYLYLYDLWFLDEQNLRSKKRFSMHLWVKNKR